MGFEGTIWASKDSRNDMGFEGFTISDWMAIDQLNGTYDSDVETSIKGTADLTWADLT